ncbi:MAG: TetR/AcrR family transcriptional regulator [Pseudomonadota bacterium]
MNESRDTRQALLASARKLFARSGYDGTSIKAITSAAHANLGAVTYHFGTKDNLYEEVIRSLVGPLLAEVQKAGSVPGAPIDRIEACLRAYFHYMYSHPEGLSIMMHELTLGRKLPAPIRESMGPLLALIGRVVQDGQGDGSIIEGDPRLMTISTIAQAAFLLIVRRPLREIAGIDILDRLECDRVLEHIVAFARRGLVNTNGGPA